MSPTRPQPRDHVDDVSEATDDLGGARAWTGRVFVGVSLDGYLARPDDDLDWLTDPPPGRSHARVSSDRPALTWETFYPDVDHILMGRRTYDKVLTFGDWPYPDKSVVVVSRTRRGLDDRVTSVTSLQEASAVLRSGGAEQVYVDGGALIRSCLERGLIDEITVSTAPVLLGEGIPLFGRLARDVLLTLTGSHVSDSGMVCATYRVAAACVPGLRD